MRVYPFEDSLFIQLADGVGEPRMTELAPGVWVERDRDNNLTGIEVLLASRLK